MFQKLHVQLTLFCTLICGMILVLMSLICLSVSEKESRKRNFADFRINVNMLVNHLENQTVISYAWISQFCADTHFELDIRDNGSRLVFDALAPSSMDEAYFNQVRQKAKTDYGILEESVTADSILSTHEEFELTINGTAYYGAMVLIPKNKRALNIAVLYSMSGLHKRVLFQRLLFAGADIFGVLLLSVFFWFFTWRMIQPLAVSRQKQAEFVASASHELRSPLTVMLSCLSAMKQASPAEAAHFSETIEQEGKRMGRLIEDMLTLSGTDSSHFAIRKKPVELDTLLLSAYEKFEPLARKKCISLQIFLPEEMVRPCLCDKERMEQVFAILLDNAISYTPKEGCISLSLKNSSDKLTFRIADNGVGIPDTEKEAVFERFYRCDKSHKDKSHFGLGLCIAREIIQMHRGKLWIEDTPGGGATFVVELNLHFK
jgi:signal transduction histidine kinase